MAGLLLDYPLVVSSLWLPTRIMSDPGVFFELLHQKSIPMSFLCPSKLNVLIYTTHAPRDEYLSFFLLHTWSMCALIHCFITIFKRNRLSKVV